LLILAAITGGQDPETIDVAALDDAFFGGLVAFKASAAASPIAGRDLEEITGAYTSGGPERMLDFTIRTGPYGDAYGARPDGLTLAALQAQPHGLDLGPLAPRLAEVLAPDMDAVELAPAHVTADLPRLERRLDRRDDRLLLVSRRHLRSNNSWMHNVAPLMTGRPRCTLLVHPDDATRIGLADGATARVSSESGSVVAPVEVTDEMMPGVVSLPHGFGHDKPGTRLAVAAAHAGANTNVLAPGDLVDVPSGNAVLNGIPVQVAAVS
jgi:anaerobic selenocysteine-containing dehydrogenase